MFAVLVCLGRLGPSGQTTAYFKSKITPPLHSLAAAAAYGNMYTSIT